MASEIGSKNGFFSGLEEQVMPSLDGLREAITKKSEDHLILAAKIPEKQEAGPSEIVRPFLKNNQKKNSPKNAVPKEQPKPAPAQKEKDSPLTASPKPKENMVFITALVGALVIFGALLVFFVIKPPMENPTANVPLAGDNTNPTDEIVATVGGEKIYLSELDARYATVPEELQAQLPKLTVLQNMIDNRLVLLEAKKKNIEATQAEIDAALVPQKDQVDAMLKEGKVTEEFLVNAVKEFVIVNKYLEEYVFKDLKVDPVQVEAFFTENKDQIVSIRASHILVETEEEANAILQELKTGKTFAELAKEKSTDKASGELGGDLGFFTKADMVPEFSDAAFSMKAGDEPKIAKSQFGYHVIIVTELKDQFEDYKEQIEGFLLQQAQDKAYADFIAAQKTEKGVEILLKE